MDIKNNMYYYERNLNEYATYDKDAIRMDNLNKDIRPCFFRDSDRIIHSLSFTRYSDKTQVFSNKNNDHISRRIIHVQLVSKIARTIGRALRLNEDLIEAIALGHDLGHVPFGHVGEKILNRLSIEHGEGVFMHNIQSVRTLMFLENKGEGCNLTIQVLDGIMCHNGEKLLNKYTYENKSVEDFINQYNNSYTDKSYSNNLIPMTLEACVVRISDIIGYIGRDLDDAFLVNQLNENIIPSEIKNVLGSNNREIVNNLILDIINNSYGKNYITMSDDAFNSLNELIRFNYDNIYLKANTKEEVLEYELMFSTVFDKCIYILENNLTEYNIFIDYLNRMNDQYRNCNSNTRIVLDFIAGMTDSYFVNEFEILKKI